jgi:hypothetical protein
MLRPRSAAKIIDHGIAGARVQADSLNARGRERKITLTRTDEFLGAQLSISREPTEKRPSDE